MISKKRTSIKTNQSHIKVVIAGCGNYGRNLANTLAESGKEVIIIEKNREKLETLSKLSIQNDLIVGFLGDVTISEDLLEIDIGTADLFIATTGSDSVNALAAQKIKLMYGVNDVICIMSDVSKQKLYESLGIKIVNHTEIAIQSLIDSSLES
ncbi:MAG: hypothetical protein CL880_03775 [Dehalococcoidia bacterium]|nr:hypothetical protein [Dehalococcoidia bacterium]|tara:strand:- start:186 stop:644 length:459 start_codon:yes stop_codon:yes gene_type:complete